MLVRIPLWLLGSAFLLFIVLTILFNLHLLFLSELLLRVTTKIWFSGGVLLSLNGLAVIAHRIIRQLMMFFSVQSRFQRRLLFNLAKQAQFDLLHAGKAHYINYFCDLKRRHLLKVNDRKHILLLIKSIKQNLNNKRHKLPQAAFKQYRQQLKLYTRQQNLDNLLELQELLVTLL